MSEMNTDEKIENKNNEKLYCITNFYYFCDLKHAKI